MNRDELVVDSRTSLDTFNRAVSHWSNQFAPELRRVAYVIGSRMGWDHNEFQIAWSSIQRHYEKAHGESISLNTLKKHARNWADAGGLKIIAGCRENVPARPAGYADKNAQQRGGKRQNGDASTTFGVDFSIVVKSRRAYTGERGRPVTEYYTEPWTFGQTAPAREESQTEHRESTITDPSLTPHSPLIDPSLTPYSSFDFSENSSSDSSSSGRADARDDDGGQEDPSKAKSKSNPPRSRISSDYRAAVCRALNEHLDDDLDPRLLPSATVDLLFRLWPDAQDVPAAEIGYGHLEESWRYSDDATYRSEAAVLANALKSADEAMVRSWVERGAQRLAEMDDADRAEREAEAERQRQAEEEAERRAEADRKREAVKAEIESLIPQVATGWYTSEPADAHANAVHRASRTMLGPGRMETYPEVLARLRRSVADNERPKSSPEAQSQYDDFIVRYAEWAASRP